MFVTLKSLEKVIPVLEEGDKALSAASARDPIMNAQTNLFFQMGLQNPELARAGMAAVNPLLGHLNSNMLDVVSGYQSGKINFPKALKQWQDFTRDSYKKLFLTGTKAAGNPYYNKLGLTRKDLAFIDKAIRYESRFFKKFLFDIKDPKHLPASRIPRDASGKMLPGYRPQKFDYLKRASMYAQTGKAQVFNGMIAGSPQELVDIYWVLGTPQTESCSDCIRLARRKWTWKTLPTTPRAGDTACKWKCYCRLEIRPKKAGPKMTVPGRATAGALMTAGRHARVYNAQGMEMTGTIQAEVEAIYAQMYKARQMMRITADAERMEWILWRKALNRQLIDRLQHRGYRTTPTISVSALLKTVDAAKAAGGKLSSFRDLFIGDEVIFIRGDFSGRGVVTMVNNKLVFRNSTGVDLIITDETDIMFLMKKFKQPPEIAVPGRLSFHKNLTAIEKQAISEWGTETYEYIRTYLLATTAERKSLLAGWGEMYGSVAKTAKILEKLFRKYRDGAQVETLYRGLGDLSDSVYRKFKNYKTGEILKIDKSMTSWTRYEDVARSFTESEGERAVVFYLKKGRKTTLELDIEKYVLYTKEEAEVLVRTTEFRVTKIVEELGLAPEKTLNIYLEEI